jgi:hypothetical protein
MPASTFSSRQRNMISLLIRAFCLALFLNRVGSRANILPTETFDKSKSKISPLSLSWGLFSRLPKKNRPAHVQLFMLEYLIPRHAKRTPLCIFQYFTAKNCREKRTTGKGRLAAFDKLREFILPVLRQKSTAPKLYRREKTFAHL